MIQGTLATHASSKQGAAAPQAGAAPTTNRQTPSTAAQHSTINALTGGQPVQHVEPER
jgi:hypothetical protein